jgi:hypothetical protein
MLYEIIPNAPQFDTDVAKPMLGTLVDGVIGVVVNQVMDQVG